MKIGDDVRLIPTLGSYQEEKVGRLVGQTRTEWRVCVDGNSRPIRFRKSNGSPVEKFDQRFPRYYLRIA